MLCFFVAENITPEGVGYAASCLLRCPKMLNRVEIWGLGWPVHDLNLVIFEPRSGFFALVFGVIVLLKKDILVLFLEILDRSQEFILQNAAIKVKVHL